MPDQDSVSALMRIRTTVDQDPVFRGSAIYYVDDTSAFPFRSSNAIVSNDIIIEKYNASEPKSASKYLWDVAGSCGPVVAAGVLAGGEEVGSLGTLTPLAVLTLAGGAAGAYKCGTALSQLGAYLVNPVIADDLESAKAHPYYNAVNDLMDLVQLVQAASELKLAMKTVQGLTELRSSWFKERNYLTIAGTRKYYNEFANIMGTELKRKNFAQSLRTYGYEKSFSRLSNPANVYINQFRVKILKVLGKDIIYDGSKLIKNTSKQLGEVKDSSSTKKSPTNSSHRVHIAQSVGRNH
jgi:hypothetical protein